MTKPPADQTTYRGRLIPEKLDALDSVQNRRVPRPAEESTYYDRWDDVSCKVGYWLAMQICERLQLRFGAEYRDAEFADDVFDAIREIALGKGGGSGSDGGSGVELGDESGEESDTDSDPKAVVIGSKRKRDSGRQGRKESVETGWTSDEGEEEQLVPPGKEIYLPATKSRLNNAWLNSLEVFPPEDGSDLQDMRSIQTTYHVQLTDFPQHGHNYRIWLLWDYDRIWGVFDLGHTKGIFLVDPGPRPSSHDADPQRLPFIWRGIRKSEPDTLLCNTLITKGEICIHPSGREFEGHFEFMAGNEDAGGERCAFHAKAHFGPGVVPYSLEKVVDEWNGYSALGAEERIRQYLSPSELAADLRKRDEERAELATLPASALPRLQQIAASVPPRRCQEYVVSVLDELERGGIVTRGAAAEQRRCIEPSIYRRLVLEEGNDIVDANRSLEGLGLVVEDEGLGGDDLGFDRCFV
ncbi:hypothetical protein BJX61DRAFT_547409 [Aspergillus egyptiacus]|nr:hypothetical protein BJX61DRAFT_547409 [Aspergillus egyptiacus]